MNCQVDEQEQKDEGSSSTLKEQDTKVWTARIVQIRGVRDEIWIRVEWYYSPEDLQGGRRTYHGKYEIVRSTLEDVISAEAVAGLAEVVHWNENDDGQQCLNVLFWRQTCDPNGNKLSVIPWKFLGAETSRNQDRIASAESHTILMQSCTDVTTVYSGNMNNV